MLGSWEYWKLGGWGLEAGGWVQRAHAPAPQPEAVIPPRGPHRIPMTVTV